MPTDVDGSGLSKRRRVVVSVALGAALLSVGGLTATTFVKSPAQAAAEAQAPAPDVLSAPVERRVLADTLIARGIVSASQTVDVAPAGSSAEGGARPVITKVMLQPGATFKAGRVLLEISGRPVFALPGTLPVYRDLKPGAHGDDVRQLQSALRSLGHGTGSDDEGEYGAGTKSAVGAFYESIGYDAVPAGGTEDTVLAAARGRVKTARRALDELLAEKKAPDTVRIGYAREDLKDAQDELAKAEAVSGPMVPASEMIFLSGFPARVDSLQAKVGGTAGEKLMSVSAGDLVVKASLAANEKGLVRPGQKVEILAETTGHSATAEVVSVADAPSAAQGQDGEGDESGGQGYATVVKPDKPLPSALVGQDVRLTVEAASSGGKVLVVPVSAVSAGADAKTTVTVLTDIGARRRVEVLPGISGDGYVQVTPVAGGRLAEGERVVVGVRSAAAAAGTGEAG